MSTSHATRGTSPWTRRHLAAATALWVLAAALLNWAWYGSSKENNLDDVGPWVVVAGMAALAAGLGAMVWLSRALRSVRARQQRIVRKIDLVADAITEHIESGSPAVVASDRGVVHLPGTTLFHREGCLLVRGKDATSVTRTALESAGHRPCRVCKP